MSRPPRARARTVQETPDQTIFRVACRHKPYSQLGNAALRDNRLSLEERGALAMILSYPGNFSFNSKWLMKECDIGRDRARAIVTSLTKYGYCQRNTIRKKDGTIRSYEYVFTDEPQHLVEPQPENPGPGPQPENPGPGLTGAGDFRAHIKEKGSSLREDLKEKEGASAPEDFIFDLGSEGPPGWVEITPKDAKAWIAWIDWLWKRDRMSDAKLATAMKQMRVASLEPKSNSPLPDIPKPPSHIIAGPAKAEART